MNSLLLIFKREYVSRVTRKWFWISTFLAPIGVVAVMVIAGFLGYSAASTDKTIAVIDQTNKIQKPLQEETNSDLSFVFPGLSAKEARKRLPSKEWDGILVIPSDGIDNSQSLSYISQAQPSPATVETIDNTLSTAIRSARAEKIGLSSEELNRLTPTVDIKPQILDEQTGKESDTSENASVTVAFLFAIILGFLSFFLITTYGSMVMKSVLQEKKNRIVDLLVSSVSPFYLMLGKIFAIIAVSLSQILIWTGLLSLIFTGFRTISTPISNNINFGDFTSQLAEVNLLPMLLLFVLFFLGGYVLYASLFAMFTATSDPDAEVQQLTQLVVFPLLISFFLMQFVVQSPNGIIAFWASIIPLSSPIVMISRVPFDVPLWEILLSLFLLYATTILVIWLAGRIYRVGILMYGQRPNPKEFVRWIFSSR